MFAFNVFQGCPLSPRNLILVATTVATENSSRVPNLLAGFSLLYWVRRMMELGEAGGITKHVIRIWQMRLSSAGLLRMELEPRCTGCCIALDSLDLLQPGIHIDRPSYRFGSCR